MRRELQFRRAAITDFGELRALERAAFTQIGARFYPLADIELALEKLEGLSLALIEEGHYFVLCQEDATIVASGGWSRARPDYSTNQTPPPPGTRERSDGALVRCVYVHPDHERRGHARSVMRSIEMDARAHGEQFLSLSSSRTAFSLYRSLGYAEGDRRAVSLPNGRSIELIEMCKSLSIVAPESISTMSP